MTTHKPSNEPSLTSEFPDHATPLQVGGRLDEPARANLLATSVTLDMPHNQLVRALLVENLSNPTDWRSLSAQIHHVHDVVCAGVEHLVSEHSRNIGVLAAGIERQFTSVHGTIRGLAEQSKAGVEHLERINSLADRTLNDIAAVSAALSDCRAAVDAQGGALTGELQKSDADLSAINISIQTVARELECLKRAARVNSGIKRLTLPCISLVAAGLAVVAFWCGVRMVRLEKSAAILEERAETAAAHWRSEKQRADSALRDRDLLSRVVQMQLDDAADRRR